MLDVEERRRFGGGEAGEYKVNNQSTLEAKAVSPITLHHQ